MRHIIKITVYLLCFTITSCNQVSNYNSYLYDVINLGQISTGFYPIPLKLKTINESFVNINGRDSLIKRIDSLNIITYAESFFYKLNMKIINYNDFKKNLMISLHESNSIFVDSALFHSYDNKYNRVDTDVEIERLYNKEGITGVLNRYLDSDGWLLKYYPKDTTKGIDFHGKGVNINYILYLSGQHNIYFFERFHGYDEIAGLKIMEGMSDKRQHRGLKKLNP